MIARALLFGAAVVVTTAGVASAQTSAPAYRRWHVIFAGGVTAQSGYPVGDINAELRRNAMGPPQPVPLFRAESEMQRAAAAEVRVALGLSPTLAIEVAGTFAQPQLNVRITADAEAGDAASAGERVSQYAVDVSGVFLLPDLGFGRRARAYLIGGGGYLRQLHEGRLRIDTGSTVHGGGGVQYWFRGGGNPRQRPFGLRGEARFVHRIGGIDYEERARNFPVVGALLFVGF